MNSAASVICILIVSVCSHVNAQNANVAQSFRDHICEIKNKTAIALQNLSNPDSLATFDTLINSFFEQYVGPVYSESYSAAKSRYA